LVAKRAEIFLPSLAGILPPRKTGPMNFPRACAELFSEFYITVSLAHFVVWTQANPTFIILSRTYGLNIHIRVDSCSSVRRLFTWLYCQALFPLKKIKFHRHGLIMKGGVRHIIFSYRGVGEKRKKGMSEEKRQKLSLIRTPPIPPPPPTHTHFLSLLP
jgi:hypothetical protein